MQKVQVPITNFQFGEVSPSLSSRTDTAVYTASAQKVENMFLRAEGGVIKRAGLEYIYRNDDITESDSYRQLCRLIPFIFSDDEQYIISIQHVIVRAFYIDPTTGNISLVSTINNSLFDATYLHEFTFAQSGDVLFVCHPTFMPQQIVRTGLHTFITEPFVFDVRSDLEQIYQPYYNFHSANSLLKPSGTSGSISLQVCHFDPPSDFPADPDGVCLSQSGVTANNPLSSVGAAYRTVSSSNTPPAIVAFSASPFNTNPRIVTITSTSNNSGVSFIVTGRGLNPDLNPNLLGIQTITQYETITGPNNGTVKTTRFFTRVDSITPTSNIVGSVSAGIDDSVGVNYFQGNYSDWTSSAGGGGAAINDGEFPNSKHLNTTIRYHDSEILITKVQSTSNVIGTVLNSLFVQLKANALKTIDGSSTVEVTHVNHGMKVGDSVTLSECAAVGNISTSNLNGARTILKIIDDNHYTFTAGGAANASVDGGGSPKITSSAPTTDWSEQSFSGVRGFPAAVTFHQNRLCFAGTVAQPDSVYMSKSNAFYNFDVGDANDSDSIQITASGGEVQQIRHLLSNRDLQIFSASSELYIPSFQDKPLTPTNAQIRRQTPFGSDFIRPQALDGATVFVQAGGSIVREYLFTDAEAAYTAIPVSTLSSHLIVDPVEMNTFYGAIDRSESYIFLINKSGNMAVFNSNRAEQRAGWVEFTSQCKFISTTTVDDRVFAFVSCLVNNGNTTAYFLCEFKSSANMDLSKSYTENASNSSKFNMGGSASGGIFYENDVVNVVSGNNYIGEFTVGSGNVLDISGVSTLSEVEVGLKFDVNLKTNPIDTNTQAGPVSGKIRSLASVVVDLNNTLSVSVNNTNLVIRQVNDDLSQEQVAVTGRKEFRLMGYGRTPQVTISQSAPLPLQVNGLIAELVF